MTLDEETELMNVAIREAESKLVALKLGVEASVHLDPNHELHFRKSGSDWGLFVVSRAAGSATPLLRSSRALRVAASDQFVALYLALVEAHQEQRKAVLRASLSATAFVAWMRNRALAEEKIPTDVE